MKNRSYAVFGLGRYGRAVAKELVDNGNEVIAVDDNQDVVNEAAADIPLCKCADVTDADVIARLGIADVDTVIICMANSLEASVMAITLCKEAGVKNVIAKCGTEMHQKIMLRVGADQVVFPENESGIRLAKNLISSVQGRVYDRNRRQRRVGRQESDRAESAQKIRLQRRRRQKRRGG